MPKHVKQIIELGMKRGYTPEDPNSGVGLSSDEVDMIFYYGEKQIEVAGHKYTYVGDLKGGLSMKIRSAEFSKGQLLVMDTNLTRLQFLDESATNFIN